jgi:heme a synthase
MAHADTPSLSRLRSRAVSLRTFQRMAVVTLVILWLVVTTGALVRLTASGLGCPHWPTCQANQLVPQDSAHALIEFSNRAISGLAMLAAVATAIMAYRVVGLDRRIAHALAIAAAGTVAQVPLGAVTVAFDLNPYLVISHFLLAMVVVSFSTWATVRALRPKRVAAAPPARRLGLVAWAAVVAYLALITSGAFVTAAGPHPGSTSTPIERLGNFYDSAYVHVRVATTFTVLFVAVAVWLWRRFRGSGAQRLAAVGVVLLACQAGVGEYQYRNGLPWAVIAVHVALAATLLIIVVAVASLVWERDEAPAPS